MSMYDRHNYLFCDGDLFPTLEAHFEKIQPKTNAIPEAQFLNTDDDTIVESIVSEMEVQPLELHEDAMKMEQEETKVDASHRIEYAIFGQGGPVMVPGLKITVSIPYTGDTGLWKLKPNRWRSTFPRANVRRPGADGIGYLDITISQPSNTSSEVYKKILESTLGDIRFYLDGQKAQIEQKNKELEGKVRGAVAARRARLQKHASVIEALNIPLKKRDGAPDISRIPIKRKLVKPLPPAPNKPSEPGISNEDYEHILSVVRHEGRSFEATPATFAVHDEEQLRDIILAHLNGHYQGDATGETFRRSGKTDIRIEDKNRAAFVAECKVWRGAAELNQAVDQLLGYLTWRDCKTALVVFNKHVAGFTEIQQKVPGILGKHPNCETSLDSKQAGEWRFVFHSKEDAERKVVVHVFLFNLYVGDEK